jgi:hypothetical protein
MSVKDGRLVLPDGIRYRLLVLPNGLDQLTPPVMRKLRDFVAAGATVVGPEPTGSPSLVGQPAADDEVRSLGNEVWGDCDGRTIDEHAYGKGKVYWGKPLREVLAALATPPDFEHTRPAIDATLVYIHRRLGDTEFYFVANQKDRAEDVDVRLRVDGKAAEIWHPETGEIGATGYRIEAGRTTVPLSLGPHEAVFVVFRQAATSPSRVLPWRKPSRGEDHQPLGESYDRRCAAWSGEAAHVLPLQAVHQRLASPRIGSAGSSERVSGDTEVSCRGGFRSCR